jgi:hypothetical protein
VSNIPEDLWSWVVGGHMHIILFSLFLSYCLSSSMFACLPVRLLARLPNCLSVCLPWLFGGGGGGVHQFPVSSRFKLKFHAGLRVLICMSLSLCISCTGLYYSLYISSLGRVYYCTLLLDTSSLSVSLRGEGISHTQGL